MPNCPTLKSPTLHHRHGPRLTRGWRTVLRLVLAATAVTGATNSGAQTPDWSVLVAPPPGSSPLANCASGANAPQAIAAAESIVRQPQGDVFVVSCPAATPPNLGSIASTAVSIARLNGTSGSVVWRRDFSGMDTSYYTLIRNFIAIDVAGNVIVASSISSEETGEFTYVLKYDGATGQPAWQSMLNAPTFALDVLTSGNVRINNGNSTMTLLGSTGATSAVFDFSQALPDRGGVPLVGGGLAYLALTSDDGTVRRVAKFLDAGLPGAPTITNTFASNEIISMAFLPPAGDGGSPILDYRLTCQEDSGSLAPVTRTTFASPATYYVDFDENPSYVNGVSLRCFIQARNLFGFGAASGVRTFFGTYSPLALFSVVSRKTHGTSGVFDLLITRNIAQSGPVTVEPRATGNGHFIVFQFTNRVDNVSNLLLTVGMSPAVPLSNFSIVDNELRVLLPAASVPDASRARISGSINSGTVSFAESLGFLLGDADNTRIVDSIDVTAIRARSGQRASPENFRFDINASGIVSASDFLAVRARNSRVLGN